MAETPAEFAYRINRRDAERAHDRSDAVSDMLDQAAISTGTTAIRSAILINGGAAIAMLGFIGALVGQGKIDVSKLDDVASSLMWFAFGVAAAFGSLGAAYFTNYFASEATGAIFKMWEHPYVKPAAKQQAWLRCRRGAQIVAVVCGLSSLGLFVKGMLDVRESIGRLAFLSSPIAPPSNPASPPAPPKQL